MCCMLAAGRASLRDHRPSSPALRPLVCHPCLFSAEQGKEAEAWPHTLSCLPRALSAHVCWAEINSRSGM